MGKPRNTRKYPTYPEIPEIKKDTRKYPIIYFYTPTRPTRPATRYFVQYPTRPDIEKPYPLGTVCESLSMMIKSVNLDDDDDDEDDQIMALMLVIVIILLIYQ